MNNRKSSKNRNGGTEKHRPRSIEPKRPFLRRSTVLMLMLGLLITVFLWNGGVIGVINAMARSALAHKQFDSAKGWLRWANIVSPRNAEAEFLRGRTARKVGELDQMSEHLYAASKLSYDGLKLQREQDLALASSGRLGDGVEERLQTWLQESPPDADEIIDAYANGLTAVSRFQEATELLAAWEEDNPKEPIANYRRARIHEHFYQADLAMSEYRKALAKDPTFIKASYHLARVLSQQKQSEEAIKYFRACESGAAGLAAKTGIADCYRDLGEPEKARTILREVMKSSYDELYAAYCSVDETPERYVAASDLGCIEAEMGEFAEARKYLEIALEKFPKDSIARYSYGVTLRGLGLQQEAEENFEKTRAAREALDQVSQLQEVLRKDPYDSKSRMQIGAIILEHESERTGIFWFNSIFAYDADNFEAHQFLTEYYRKKSNPNAEDLKLADYHQSFLTKK